MITVSITRNSSNANWSWRRTPNFFGRDTVPAWGGISPVSSFMNVDLPAPLGPVRPYRRPAENVVVTSSKRIFEPNRIDTPLTEIMDLRVLLAYPGPGEPPIVTYGSLTENVVPASAVDSTSTQPRWAVAIAWTMNRPSPTLRCFEESEPAP